ncbi:glycosyl hydrolase [Novosphingobium sp. 9]|uniref:glycosyl hydrolase n=1 Tax=Novosphingobium sp. 9 TaxID=2025349 RepID=UPI0028CB36C8|nr:glycosyl hydrolase [Novosphingobium sp. 9]
MLCLASGLVAAPVLAGEPATSGSAQAPAATDSVLAQEFRDPPASARPRVWWHWMNGNITKDGIAKDLAWMKSVGIGGVQNFDANLQTPQIVDKRLAYMTPEWKDAFRFAVQEADRQGLEFAIASSPGWSETGGPWVAPKDGMKKLVWSSVSLASGQRLTGALPALPGTTGPFQDLHPALGIEEMISGHPAPAAGHFTGSGPVLAYSVSEVAALPMPQAHDGLGNALAAGALSDSDLGAGSRWRARTAPRRCCGWTIRKP